MGRNATITLENRTGFSLKLASKKIEHGKFQANQSPPEDIGLDGEGQFKVGNKTGAKVGPKGSVTYKLVVHNITFELIISWDHPFSASTSSYTVTSSPPGHCTYSIPVVPSGPDQQVRIAIELKNLSTLYDLEHWMHYVADTTSIANMSIPGTHDSCALHGGPSVETQSKTLTEQFALGIRFIDIRCALRTDGDLVVYHGIFDQNKTFRSVIADCTKFLATHPTEGIVMLLNNEKPKGLAWINNNDNDFADAVATAITNTSSDGTSWRTQTSIPTLKDARKSITLLRRFGLSDGTESGIDVTHWPDNAAGAINGESVYIQDKYKVNVVTSNLPDGVITFDHKWDSIVETLDKSMSDESGKLFLNYTSGSTYSNPENVAKGMSGTVGQTRDGMNSRLYNRLPTLAADKKIGIIPMDFPEWPNPILVALIIAQNVIIQPSEK